MDSRREDDGMVARQMRGALRATLYVAFMVVVATLAWGWILFLWSGVGRAGQLIHNLGN